MRLACLLVLAGVLLASAAFATTYTTVIYAPGPSIYTYENWFSLPGVPFPVATASGIPGNPLDIVGDLGKIDDARLVRLNAPTGNLEGYYSFQ